MDVFVSSPHLPEKKVTLAVSGFTPAGVGIIPPPYIPSLPAPLRAHADLGLCHIGGGEVVCPPETYEYYHERLSPYGFSVILGGQALGGSYPADTAYNVVVAGKYAILNPKVCDGVLLSMLENRCEIIPVKQGYAKCSVCPVAENAIITADAGIARAAEKRGIEVLPISNDGVRLPPYANGFFAGAAGKTGKDTLAVNGSLAKMQSGSEIIRFLEKHSVAVEEASSAPPFDTGSLIPLMITADNI